MNNRRGFVLRLTFVFMISLTIIVTGLLFMAAHEPSAAGSQIVDGQLVSLADAGIGRALREIRDEALSPTPTVGTADLRGADTSLSSSVTNPRSTICKAAVDVMALVIEAIAKIESMPIFTPVESRVPNAAW